MTQEPARTGTGVLEDGEPLRRVIGQVTGAQPGPTLICLGGVHGNEPAGVRGLSRVFDRLARDQIPLCGEFLGLAGNLPALAGRQRYIKKDLNRQWLTREMQASKSGDGSSADSPEDQERSELLRELELVFERVTGEVFALDLHTTSGEGAPFVVMGDTLRNRAFALRFPVPVVIGLEEYLDGTISEYLTNRGHVTVTLESGQHNSEESVDLAEAGVWVALATAGLIDAQRLTIVRESRELLARAARGLPRVLEVRYRHPVVSADGFRMLPGFRNLQRLQSGELLARDRRGDIRSRWNARLLMPLYQELGNDGFFIVREFRRAWLPLSALLRHLRLDAVVHWLPGISRHLTRPDTLVVDLKVARWHAMEVLHMLGFRRKRMVGDVLLVSRRRHDLHRSG